MSFSSQLQEQISSKITEEELCNMVRNKFGGLSDVKLKNVELSSDSGKKGDSYLSKICRFTIRATVKDNKGVETEVFVPVIAKALHTNLGRRKTYRSVDFFENEITAYTKVFPALLDFQSKKNVQNKFNHIPLLLSSCLDGDNDYVALEDLSFQDFGCADRGDALNFEHTVEILKIFAQFHGLGLAYKDQKPAEFEEVATSLKETYFAERLRGWYINFQRKNLFPIIRDAVEKELAPEYLEKLNKFLDNDLFARLCKICEVRGPFSVVTHGDSWVPNFLFKYKNDKQKPSELIMIDFQLTRYTTLSNDIIFFLFCCLEGSQLDKHFDDFVEIYYKHLKANVEGLGSQLKFTLGDLKADIAISVIFGIGMSIENLTMSLLEDEDVSDLDSIPSEDAVPLESVWLVYPFKEQFKRQRIAGMIKFAADRKFI